MLGGGLHRRPARQHHIGVLTGCGLDCADVHLTGGHRAGLVEHHSVNTADGLENLRLLDQHAQLGAAAGPYQDRRRRGQAQRARAGDDQHCDCRGKRHRSRVPGQQPAGQRHRRDDQDHGNEHRGHAIGEPLYGCLAALRIGDHSCHPGKLGIGTNPAGAQQNPTKGVDGSTEHRITGRHIHWHRFTGHGRGVQRRCTVDHHTVGGDPFAGAHHDHVTDYELVGADPDLLAIAHHGGFLGAQGEQGTQG